MNFPKSGISKVLWGGLKRKFQSIALGLFGMKIRIKDITPEEGELGYTSKCNERGISEIHLAYYHPVMKKLKMDERVMLVKGVFTHEMMHQLITNFPQFEYRARKIKNECEQQIFATIFNVMEDPAIEYQAPKYFGGHLLRALSYTILTLYHDSPDLQESSPFNEWLQACIQYGDGGFIKGQFHSEEARKYFLLTAPIMNDTIEETDSAKRVEYAEKVFKMTEPLWKSEVEDAEKQMELMKQLQELLEKMGKGIQGSSNGPSADEGKGGEDGEDGEGGETPSSESSRKKKSRRKITVRKVSKEEMEEMKKNASKGEIPEDGDVEICVCDEASEEGEEEKTEGEAAADSGKSGDSSSDSESSSESGSESSSDSDSSESSPKSKKENEGKETVSEYKPSKGGDANEASGGVRFTMDEDDADIDPGYAEGTGEIEDIEYELTEEDASSILKEIDTLVTEEETAKEEEASANSANLDIPEIGKLYNNLSVMNEVIKVRSDEDELMCAYQGILSPMLGGVNHLTQQLKRILQNDPEEYEHRSSGRIDIYRLNSGTLTPNVFLRKLEAGNRDDFCVELLIDESGSMCWGEKYKQARACAIGLAEVFGRLKIPMKVIGFTADEKMDVTHRHYLNWLNTPHERLKLLDIKARSNNLDGYSIRYAAKMIQKYPAEHKLLIVISDGQPAAYYYKSRTSGIADTRNAIQDTEKSGIDLIGVALGGEDTEILYSMYGNNFLRVDNANELFQSLGNTIKRKVQRW